MAGKTSKALAKLARGGKAATTRLRKIQFDGAAIKVKGVGAASALGTAEVLVMFARRRLEEGAEALPSIAGYDLVQIGSLVGMGLGVSGMTKNRYADSVLTHCGVAAYAVSATIRGLSDAPPVE